jgi:hypothetical protein
MNSVINTCLNSITFVAVNAAAYCIVSSHWLIPQAKQGVAYILRESMHEMYPKGSRVVTDVPVILIWLTSLPEILSSNFLTSLLIDNK